MRTHGVFSERSLIVHPLARVRAQADRIGSDRIGSKESSTAQSTRRVSSELEARGAA